MKKFSEILSEAREEGNYKIGLHSDDMKKEGTAMLQHKHDSHIHAHTAKEGGSGEDRRKAEHARSASHSAETMFKWHSSELKKIKDPAAKKAHADAHAHLAHEAKKHATSLSDHYAKHGGSTTELKDGARWMRERASSHTKSASKR